jgi:hypothetical protein
MIEPRDILDWCFTLASLDFGVFGFLYSVYATASFQATPEHPVRPPITEYIKIYQAVLPGRCRGSGHLDFVSSLYKLYRCGGLPGVDHRLLLPSADWLLDCVGLQDGVGMGLRLPRT